MQISDRDGAHLRATPRIKIFQPAELRCGSDAPKRVHLLNISEGGALVYGDVAAQIGAEVQLSCGLPLGAARVRWRDGQRFGVAFTRPIPAAQIEALVTSQKALIDQATQRLAQGDIR
jgi:hypothetical protein